MLKINYNNQFLASILFILLLSIAFYSYWPGTQGLFIFDDMPNLSPMGKYVNYSLWENFLLFILEGDSGPTGRPISLATFFMNDTSWPSNPSNFTLTNVYIHLLNGVLVFWLVFKLGNTLKLSQTQQLSFSLFCTSLWILHPLHTTTVLYIIQRMTELSALFTLSGLLFYLYGREKLSTNPKKGFIFLFIGVGASLTLSIFSKENGVLLVAYILTIEFFLLQPLNIYPTTRKLYYWLIPSVFAPFFLLILYLGDRALLGAGFENRDFSLNERLLTQPRILFEYIHHILLPSTSDMSIFHDDYIISRSLLSPWTTLPSIIGVTILIIMSVVLRKKQPLIAFAIIWFFIGHILESTVLSLELYFEHRNYLPMLGFLIAFSWYFTELFSSHRTIATGLAVLTTLLLSFLLNQNAILWSKPIELVANWHQAHPNSLRTQEAYLNVMKPFGVTEKDLTNEQSSKQLSKPYIRLLNLRQACQTNSIDSETLSMAIEIFRNNPIHSTASTALTSFISEWLDGSCPDLTTKKAEAFLLTLSSLERTQKSHIFAHYVHYWLSVIYRDKQDLANTMKHLDQAYAFSPDLEVLKLRAAYLTSAGLYTEALEVLNDTSLIEKKGYKSRLALTIKQDEINQLKKTISSNIAPDK